MHVYNRCLRNSGAVHFRCTCVTTVFCNYFNFPLVVLLRAARKSRGDITAEEYVYVFGERYVCACADAHDARHPLWPHSSFTRYLAFPFPLLRPVSVPPPSCSLQQPSATCTCTRAYVHVCCAKAVCSTCRGSLPMHANPVSKLSKCTRKCITDEGGGRRSQGKGVRRGDKLWIESWNCYGTA